jgi:lysozyme family protein
VHFNGLTSFLTAQLQMAQCRTSRLSGGFFHENHMTDIRALTVANADRWAKAKITRDASATARRLVAAKVHYQAVEKATGVPWAIIAVIHEREASQSWSGSLAQGDPWNQVSIHVPAGRGPFKSWEEAAIDALVNCPPYAARWKDWTAGGAMTLLEQYNGLGYARMGRPSPYVWAGTDQYTSGKYVRDGEFDPNVVDKQFGCACVIKFMMAIDPTITFTGATLRPVPAPAAAPTKPAAPSITNPSKGSIGAFIANLFTAIFGRK